MEENVDYLIEKLTQYKKMLDDGLIEKDEYELLKKKALESSLKDDSNPKAEKVSEPVLREEETKVIVDKKVISQNNNQKSLRVFAKLASWFIIGASALAFISLVVPILFGGNSSLVHMVNVFSFMGPETPAQYWFGFTSGSSYFFVRIIGAICGYLTLFSSMGGIALGIVSLCVPNKLGVLKASISVLIGTMIIQFIFVIIGITGMVLTMSYGNVCTTFILYPFIPFVGLYVSACIFISKYRKRIECENN